MGARPVCEPTVTSIGLDVGHIVGVPTQFGAEQALRAPVPSCPVELRSMTPADLTHALHAIVCAVAERHGADASEVVTERELTERLAPFGPDTAALRRAMVDAEVLERTRSGSEYARVAQASAEPSR